MPRRNKRVKEDSQRSYRSIAVLRKELCSKPNDSKQQPAKTP